MFCYNPCSRPGGVESTPLCQAETPGYLSGQQKSEARHSLPVPPRLAAPATGHVTDHVTCHGTGQHLSSDVQSHSDSGQAYV